MTRERVQTRTQLKPPERPQVGKLHGGHSYWPRSAERPGARARAQRAERPPAAPARRRAAAYGVANLASEGPT